MEVIVEDRMKMGEACDKLTWEQVGGFRYTYIVGKALSCYIVSHTPVYIIYYYEEKGDIILC